jgi:hypothetical protein
VSVKHFFVSDKSGKTTLVVECGGILVDKLAPHSNSGLSRITRNEAALRANHETGIEYGNKFMKEWN